jgi:isoleucyl-tRNA synthetase
LKIHQNGEQKEEINRLGSIELYNEIEKFHSGRFKENLLGFEIGNMDEANYDLVDLHKT